MVTKKDLVIAVLSTFCLTAALFMITVTRGTPDEAEYDPRMDYNGDGVINMRDIGYVCGLFQTEGEPINWTEVIERIENLEDNMVEKGWTAEPEYDSWWREIEQGGSILIYHGLNSTNLFVYLVARYYPFGPTEPPYIHQHGLGMDYWGSGYKGISWTLLEEGNYIAIERGANDLQAEEVRVRIWKIPEP